MQVPVDRPSAIDVYAQSWSGARAVLASRPRFYWAWIVAAALVGALAMLVPDSLMQVRPGELAIAAAIPAAFIGLCLMAAVLTYFVLADAVRAVVPAFRMTPLIFIFVLLLNAATGTAVQIAIYCLVIPAFYVAPKLWLWVPNYLLYNTERMDVGDAVVHAWRDTNNVYWPTLGLMALQNAVAVAIVLLGLGLAALAVQLFHPFAIVATPAVLALLLFLTAQVDCAWIAWAVAIRRHAEALQGASL